MRISKLLFSFFMSVTLFAQVSWAQLVSTEALFEQPVAVSSKEKVVQFVARDEVAKTFQELGVDPQMVEERLASLTDEELTRIATQIDTLPAGGDAVGALISAAIFVFVLLLITDLLGLTRVFSFTRPIVR
jgi:hypothetical protein